ncbi:MAG: hypothetical protein P1P90_01930 [Patescibacteria group bacterium]|nr:hypothetical protein [Patescibacteria group bacterium]
MKHIVYTVLTILGAIALATLLANLTGCGGSSQALNLAKQNRQDLKYEERNRDIADRQLERAINDRHTDILNLQHELKKLRAVVEVICSKNPDQCKSADPEKEVTPEEVLPNWR